MALSRSDIVDLVTGDLLPVMRAQRDRMDKVDKWLRGEHALPYRPREATAEYKALQDKAITPYLRLVVTAVAQALAVDGYGRRGAADSAPAWTDAWQPNGLDARQIAVHRGALGFGLSFVTVLPGDPAPVIRGVSARRMATWYGDDGEDDWPLHALRAEPAGAGRGWTLRYYDDEQVHYLGAESDSDKIDYIEGRAHDLGVVPVIRFANEIDLDGRVMGEVAPLIPMQARIDQTVFDRLLVQTYGSWKVRTVAGLAKPANADDAAADKVRLSADRILMAEDPDTKFGTLDGTPLAGYIEAKDADVHDLAAISQTPPHALLGQMANLSAEALAAAESSLMRKVDERKQSFGEAWEQVLRLAAHAAGDTAGAADFGAQVRWRDTESRSLAQTADALGKLAQMLGVPVQMLWTKIPGWTDQDVAEAKRLAAEGDGLGQLEQLLDRQMGSPGAPSPAPDPPAPRLVG